MSGAVVNSQWSYNRKTTLPQLDISGDSRRQTIISDGREVYQGHPTTVLMPDGRTVFCVWTVEHGGPCGFLKKSTDCGRTWSELLPVPVNWSEMVNCPCIWLIPAPGQSERLVVYAQHPETREMHVSVSEDGGSHWTPMTPCGIISVMPWTAVFPLPDGGLLAQTNARCPGCPDPLSNRIIQAYSTDYGVTWSTPGAVAEIPGAKLTEPWIIQSPDGKEMACLIRVNNRIYNSMIMFSSDHGNSWSPPVELPDSLTGDRHIARYLPDGRIIVVFRDTKNDSPTYGHFCGWVGSWDDLKLRQPGTLRLKLLHHYATSAHDRLDCGYPGLEVFGDGSILATTYLRYRAEDKYNSVVCTRLDIDEIQGN